jgi:hypothetical protein
MSKSCILRIPTKRKTIFFFFSKKKKKNESKCKVKEASKRCRSAGTQSTLSSQTDFLEQNTSPFEKTGKKKKKKKKKLCLFFKAKTMAPNQQTLLHQVKFRLFTGEKKKLSFCGGVGKGVFVLRFFKCCW